MLASSSNLTPLSDDSFSPMTSSGLPPAVTVIPGLLLTRRLSIYPSLYDPKFRFLGLIDILSSSHVAWSACAYR